MPTLNPDGFESSAVNGLLGFIPGLLGSGVSARRRTNANYVDLNRDFPGKNEAEDGESIYNLAEGREPETV